MIDIKRCTSDFEYYSSACLKIKSKGKIIPFNFNEPQRKIHNIISQREREGELQRYLILKARHEGVSTYFEGRNFWNAHMRPNTRNMIIAHEKESATAIFQMCTLFLQELPLHLKPMIKYSSKKEIYFANPDPKTEHIEPGLRSSLSVLTAGKDSVGRGFSFDAGGAHFSEVAFYPNPEDTVLSVMSILPLTQDVIVAFESTANGVGNFFYDEWQAATAGESNFCPIFLAWYELEDYSVPFKTKEAKTWFMQKLKDDEKELLSKYPVSPENLLWRRMKLKEYKGDIEKFNQEFPATAEEAFVLSGTPVFDRRKLKLIYKQCHDPNTRGQITIVGFNHDPKGELRIWERPINDAIYVIGVDASGGEGGDFACIQILKVLKYPLVAQQVAEWHGQIDSVVLADVVKSLANWYNEALVAIEVYPNPHGAVTQNTLLKNYFNLYRQEFVDRYNVGMSNKYGWETNVRTKPQMTSFAIHCIGTSETPTYVHLESKDLLKEMMVYVKDGTAANARTGHDDRVVAFLIALYVLHETSDYYEQDDIVMTKKEPSIIKRPNYVDPDWRKILANQGMSESERNLEWADY
uniref:Putative terminase n=1 Tax=viral metagenome TaxID=1070528 RepID=A0A6M3KBT2_9ZZZZ